MQDSDPLEELRRGWRLAAEAWVPDRLSTARRQLQEELDKSVRTLDKARQEHEDDPPFWIRAASHFPRFKKYESLFSDPLCNRGWRTPIEWYETRQAQPLSSVPDAKIGYVVNLYTPNSTWFPIIQHGGSFGCVVQWAPTPDWSEARVNNDDVDRAIRWAKEAIADWQAFWSNDAHWQKEFPDEWLRIHFERLRRHVAVVMSAEQPGQFQTDEERLKRCITAARAVKAVLVLPVALVKDVTALGLSSDCENLESLKWMASAASKVCAPILQSELGSQEFWTSLRNASAQMAKIKGAVKAGDSAYKQTTASIGAAPNPAPNDLKPFWDKAKLELRFRGDVIRTVRGTAENCRRVLDSFQELEWDERIDDPLPSGPNPERIGDTVRRLNEGLTAIRFCGGGDGKSFRWEFTNAPAAP